VTTAISICCFAFGACTGSFLGLCVYRLPRGQSGVCPETSLLDDSPISLSKPARSFCPVCKNTLHFSHIIPIISWFILRGRCAYCRAKIPARDTMIELLSGSFATLSYLHFGLTPTAFMIFATVSVSILITFIGIDHRTTPYVRGYPGVLLGVLLGLTNSLALPKGITLLDPPFVQSYVESLLGIIAGAVPLLVVRRLSLAIRKSEGVELGDLKLIMSIGALFGYECAIVSVVFGGLLQSVMGLIPTNVQPGDAGSHIPYGPCLSVAALGCIFLIS
jgi:leader peptidase (prepilin peptidase)/N-methyltransferase